MATIYELAKNVDRAQQELERAKQALLSAIAGGKHLRGAAPGRRRGPGSDSVSQQVLLFIQATPAGVPRKAILEHVGRENEGAMQSALKKHAEMKRIKNNNGAWTAVVKKEKAPQP